MRPQFIPITLAMAALVLGVRFDDARAVFVSGNAQTQALGGAPQYVNLTDPESTTGLLQTNGTCSNARAQATLSASAGTQSLLMYAGGSPGPSCGSTAYAAGNVACQDQFSIQSGTLAPGTLVDVSLCVHAAMRHGHTFQCGGDINEGISNSVSCDVSILWGAMSQAAHGTFGEGQDCFNAYSASATGLFASAAGETLTLSGVPVGANLTLSASMSSTSSATSVLHPSEAHVEIALVYGYSSTSDVKLISTSTSTELNPASLCSDSIANSLLPPDQGVLAVDERGPRSELELLPPAPNPASGPVSVSFVLPREEPVELAIFDLAGARVARLARGTRGAGLHSVVWNGRDEGGRSVGAGLYWFRLVTPEGRASRMIARTR